MQSSRTALQYLRIAADLFTATICFAMSVFVEQDQLPFFIFSNLNFLYIFLILSWYFSSKMTDLYDEFRSRNFSYELMLIFKNIFIHVISLIVILFFMKDTNLSRRFVLFYTTSFTSFIVIEKLFLRWALNAYRRRGRNLRTILIIGAGKVGMRFYDEIISNPHFGYRFVGFLDDNDKTTLNGMYLGKISRLEEILSAQKVENIIIALPNYAKSKIEEVMNTCERHTTRVRIIPDYFQFTSKKYGITMFGSFPMLSVRQLKLDEVHWQLLKRTTDLFISSLVIILIMSWLFPLIALLIKLESRGPVVFKQERWGRYNERFPAYKFRSMRVSSRDTDINGKYQQATKDDPRITKIGKFLRKTNLDEMPQFLNVLLGHMSIVGPRPHPTPLNMESRNKVQNYMLRTLVKPGITGWAQVNGFRGETKDTRLMQLRVDHDLWYIENWSYMLDIQILFLTVWRMIKGDPNAY